MKKRLLALLLVLMLVVSLLPVGALAAGDGEYDIVRLMDRSEWSEAVHARAGVEVGSAVSIQRIFVYDANHNQMNTGAASGLLTPDCYYADTYDVSEEDIQTIVVILTSDGKTISAVFDTEDFEVTDTGGVAATKHIELTLTERGKGRPSGHQVNFYAELNNETTYSLYDTIYVQDGQQIGDQMPNDPPVGSYVFLGWQTEEDGGISVDRNTYVYSDMNVYAAKGTSGTGHAQEYHVMGSTDKRSNALAIEVADHYNSANNTDYGVESFTIEDISVNGTASNTNPIYAENEWKDEGSYYYVYNVSRDPVEVIPENHNDRVEVADITGITVYGKLNGSDYSQFIPVSELSITEVQDNVVVELRVREKLDGVTKELVTTSDVSAPSVEGVTIPDVGETVVVPKNGSVTLMYKISVFGDAGAAYNVTDENASVVDGYSLYGTIDSSKVAVIYVTRTYTSYDIVNGSLSNTITVVPGDSSTVGTDDGDDEDEAVVDAEVDDDPQPPVESVTLTYDANGGTGAPDPQTVETGTTVDLTKAKQPTHDNVGDVPILFVGWTLDEYNLDILTKDSEPEEIPQLSTSLMMTQDFTVYAVWAEDSNENGKPDYQETDIVVIFDPAPGTTSGQTEVTLKPFGTSFGQAPVVTAPTGQKFVKWQLVGGDAADTLADKAYFTFDSIFEMANGAFSVTFKAEYENLPASETDPVNIVIYRNGDTDEEYSSTRIGEYAKGETVDLSKLNINDYYSSANGFEFEGWYNDDGWNKYKDGDPDNTLGDSIIVNGWTNIICMVTDYEKVVVKSVIDGDKDNAETIYTGEALHGTNLIEYLEDNVTLEQKPGYELDKWYNWDWYGHEYSDTTTVNGWTNVYVTYTSVEPDAPTEEDLAELKLKVQIDCIDLGVHPNRDYAIEEGTFTTEIELVNGVWQCDLSVQGSDYLTKYNSEFGKHEFSGSSTKAKTLVYGATGWTLENPGNDRIVFDVKCVEPDAPTYDVLKDMIKVQIDCINKEVSHSNADYDLIENSYDLGTLTANADGTWSCTLTVKSDAYVAKYNETKPGHTLVDAYASKDIELVYSVDGKWSRADTSNNIAAVFDVKCEAIPATPITPLPTEGDIAELIDGKIIVDCVNDDVNHANKNYGLVDDALMNVAMTDSTTVKVTLSANVYLAKYNDDDTSAKHSLADGQSETVTITLKYVDDEWTLPADAGELPATIKVVCETPVTPEPTPDITGFTKELVTDRRVYWNNGIAYPEFYRGDVIVDEGDSVTLIYKLTVTGTEGTEYTFSDAGAEKLSGSWSGTLGADGTASVYVSKTFSWKTIRNSDALYNTAYVYIAGEDDPVESDTVKIDVDIDWDYDPPADDDDDTVYVPNWLNTTDHFAYLIGYEDGEIKPENNITRAEVATIFFRLLTDDARARFWSSENDYTDVATDSWYNNAVSTLSNMGIINGYDDGTFQPNASITRAEFTAIATRFFDYTAEYDGAFNDVASGSWYVDYVQAAVDMGLVDGYPDGGFHPNSYITRAEAVTIVNRVLNRVPHEDYLLSTRVMNTWPDNVYGAWYYADMQEATNSHDYDWIRVSGERVEEWTEKLTERDWAALEQEWSTAYSG